MQIPIENIYYLLCYAWDNVKEKGKVQIEAEQIAAPLDLLVHLLIKGSAILLKKGLDHNYQETVSEVPGIKGKFLFSRTVKTHLLFHQRTICMYDEFSADILANRIWITTFKNVLHIRKVNKQLKYEIVGLLRMLPPVTPLRIASAHFNDVKLNRNNRFYQFILNICRLIHECTVPTETEGEFQFMDFTREEKKMALIFEAFVRNFYKLEQHTYSVLRERLKWQFRAKEDNHRRFLPRMETDISLENEKEKIIIDTKYYTQTLISHYDREKIYSGNLYQLFSYLMNLKDQSEKSRQATGILLYPTVEQEYDLEYQYQQHPIRIHTVNLNAHWTDISRRLKEIIRVDSR
ncbi:MAG: hypothetical protein LUG96_00335 [Tannerellaceae bacterium]|nr:hypothetical protein [Tannerellaceae bacterium]